VWHFLSVTDCSYKCYYAPFMYKVSCPLLVIFIPFPVEKNCDTMPVQCHCCPIWTVFPQNVASCSSSLASVFNETDQVPDRRLIFNCVGQLKESNSKVLLNISWRALLYDKEFLAPRPTLRWRTTSCRLSATAYAIYDSYWSLSVTWECHVWWHVAHLICWHPM